LVLVAGDLLVPLDGRVQHYAWGHHEALPGFLGRHPDGMPWAEWWLGAHPQAPSVVGSVPATTLDRFVADYPDGTLGSDTQRRFGPRLPFLLKVLAVDRPLSLQVHPTAEQARDGYRRQQAATEGAPGLYADEWAKPEMLVALTRFDAFAGLRPPADVLARLEVIGGSVLAEPREALRADPTPAGVSRLVATLLRLAPDEAREAVAQTRAGIDQLAGERAPESRELGTTAWLADQYPADPAVVVTVLMNHVVLEPGEAMAAPAGLLHCYRGGLGLEIQGTSNNTLRAGLTEKTVDVEEVLRIVDTSAQPHLVKPTSPRGGIQCFDPGVPDFALDRICITEGDSMLLGGGAPAIVLGLDGSVHLRTDRSAARLRRGDAVFVPASAGDVTLTGMGEIARAYPGQG
jgi:mannose-6-phosphate isomerase